MSLGYTSGGFRFPFRTVKVLTLGDNVRWALRGPGLSSGFDLLPGFLSKSKESPLQIAAVPVLMVVRKIVLGGTQFDFL